MADEPDAVIADRVGRLLRSKDPDLFNLSIPLETCKRILESSPNVDVVRAFLLLPTTNEAALRHVFAAHCNGRRALLGDALFAVRKLGYGEDPMAGTLRTLYSYVLENYVPELADAVSTMLACGAHLEKHCKGTTGLFRDMLSQLKGSIHSSSALFSILADMASELPLDLQEPFSEVLFLQSDVLSDAVAVARGILALIESADQVLWVQTLRRFLNECVSEDEIPNVLFLVEATAAQSHPLCVGIIGGFGETPPLKHDIPLLIVLASACSDDGPLHAQCFQAIVDWHLKSKEGIDTWKSILAIPGMDSRVSEIDTLAQELLEYSGRGENASKTHSIGKSIYIALFREFRFYRGQVMKTVLSGVAESCIFANSYCAVLELLLSEHRFFLDDDSLLTIIGDWMGFLPSMADDTRRNRIMTLLAKELATHCYSFAGGFIVFTRKLLCTYGDRGVSQHLAITAIQSLYTAVRPEDRIFQDVISLVQTSLNLPIEFRSMVYETLATVSKTGVETILKDITSRFESVFGLVPVPEEEFSGLEYAYVLKPEGCANEDVAKLFGAMLKLTPDSEVGYLGLRVFHGCSSAPYVLRVLNIQEGEKPVETVSSNPNRLVVTIHYSDDETDIPVVEEITIGARLELCMSVLKQCLLWCWESSIFELYYTGMEVYCFLEQVHRLCKTKTSKVVYDLPVVPSLELVRKSIHGVEVSSKCGAYGARCLLEGIQAAICVVPDSARDQSELSGVSIKYIVSTCIRMLSSLRKTQNGEPSHDVPEPRFNSMELLDGFLFEDTGTLLYTIPEFKRVMDGNLSIGAEHDLEMRLVETLNAIFTFNSRGPSHASKECGCSRIIDPRRIPEQDSEASLCSKFASMALDWFLAGMTAGTMDMNTGVVYLSLVELLTDPSTPGTQTSVILERVLTNYVITSTKLLKKVIHVMLSRCQSPHQCKLLSVKVLYLFKVFAVEFDVAFASKEFLALAYPASMEDEDEDLPRRGGVDALDSVFSIMNSCSAAYVQTLRSETAKAKKTENASDKDHAVLIRVADGVLWCCGMVRLVLANWNEDIKKIWTRLLGFLVRFLRGPMILMSSLASLTEHANAITSLEEGVVMITEIKAWLEDIGARGAGQCSELVARVEQFEEAALAACNELVSSDQYASRMKKSLILLRGHTNGPKKRKASERVWKENVTIFGTKRKKHIRSRNSFIDNALLEEEDGLDAYADLEDFIVN